MSVQRVRSSGPDPRALLLVAALLLLGAVGTAFLEQQRNPDRSGVAGSLALASNRSPKQAGQAAPLRPSGATSNREPGNALVIAAAFARLRDLDSYRSSLRGLGVADTPAVDATILNRPVPSVERQTTVAGRTFSSLIIGAETWTRTAGGAYAKVTDPGHGPACGQSVSALQPCTFETMTELRGPSGGIENTFARLGDGGLVNGVQTIHWHSDAGTDVADHGRVPGSLDLWISVDRGVLVRRVFAGQGYTEALDITHIDDPANRIRRPPPASVGPSAAASPRPTRP